MHRDIRSQKIFLESALVAAAQLGVVAIGFVNNAILARTLSKEGFGEYQFLLSWAAISMIWGAPGMNTSVMKATVRGHDNFQRIARQHGLLLSTAGLLVTVGILFYFHSSNDSRWLYAALITASIPLAAFQNFDSVLTGKRDFKAARLIQLFGALMSLALTSIAAVATNSTHLVFTAFIAARYIHTAIANFYIRSLKPRESPEQWEAKLERELIMQGWRQTGLSLFTTVLARTDRLILGALDPAQLAIFHIATLIPSSIKGNLKSLLSVVATQWAHLDRDGNRQQVSKNFRVLIAFGGLAFAISSISIYVLTPILFGPAFRDSIQVGILYSTTLIPSLLTYMLGMENQMQGDGKANQAAQIIRYLCLTVCLILFANEATDAILITLLNIISELSFTLVSVFLWRKHEVSD